MGAEQHNVAVLREAYRLWHESKGGSVDHWLGLMADEVDFRSLAQGAQALSPAVSCPGRARDHVRGYLQGVTAEWDMISFEMTEFIAEDDRVVAIGRMQWRHRRSGKVVDTPKVDLWRFEGGKVVQFFELFDTAQAVACAS